jgi:hypothetical protein
MHSKDFLDGVDRIVRALQQMTDRLAAIEVALKEIKEVRGSLAPTGLPHQERR